MRSSIAILPGAWFACAVGFGVAGGITPATAQSNVILRVMAANTTSGNEQSYEAPGIRIFQGLKPDIVAIQEFQSANNTTSNALRTLVNTAFGTNYHFYCEPYDGIPNGIVSRYPFVAAGSWVDSDTGVNDRGFAWGRIDIPGPNDLYVVSVHLKASSGADNVARRAAEATEIKVLISANFPANAWFVMNIYDASEGAVSTFATITSDTVVPEDQAGDPDTNANRNERYDRVLVSFSLTNRLTSLTVSNRTFPKGLVFDSRLYQPLAEVAPVLEDDSAASSMQHMAVMRAFSIPVPAPAVPPAIIVPPQGLRVAQGANASFAVGAAGTAPLTYQWRFNQVNIAGATTSSFTQTNVQPAQRGDYSVAISNAAGFVISSNVTLELIVPPPTLTMPSAGALRWTGLSNLTYTVQASAILPASNWFFLGTATSPNTEVVFSNPPTTDPQRFFRVTYP
jgi:endonuclease/exonuclease/phosphatase family metal-dependent hydrolase